MKDLSSINNFMKNNKGYYSWIHSLNEAAIKAQTKGQEMLAEEKAKKITNPARIAQLSAQMPSAKPVASEEPDGEIDIDMMRALIQALGQDKSSPRTIDLADGAVGEYVKIRREKHAERLAARPTAVDSAPPNIDLNADGDVDGEDAAAALISFEDSLGAGAEGGSSSLPTYKLAAQARQEHARKSWEEQHRAARIAARERAEDDEELRYYDEKGGGSADYRDIKENKEIDDFVQRLIKTAPSGKIYNINEIREIVNNIKKKNLKNLNERTGQSWRERNPEAYARNVQAQQELEARRAENRRRRQEDEAYQFNREQEAKQGQGPTPSGGNLSDGASLQMGRDGNPNLPADTPENRRRMAEWRREKSDKKQADYMAARMKELSAKDPSTLTSAEAGELSLFKTMMGGKVATPGLEQRVRQRFTGARGQQGPTPDGGNLGTEDADYVFSQTVGRSQEDLINQSQEAGAREAAQKAAEQAEFDKKQAEQRRASMQNVRIQGTNMTYGQFEALTGRPYNAVSKADSDLVKKLASNREAIRYTPAGREAALTADQMNQYYAAQNAELARKQGEADRRVDRAQFEVDEFNADPKGTVQREISNIQAQPGFVERVARSMNRAVERAKEQAKLASEPASAPAPEPEATTSRFPATPQQLLAPSMRFGLQKIATAGQPEQDDEPFDYRGNVEFFNRYPNLLAPSARFGRSGIGSVGMAGQPRGQNDNAVGSWSPKPPPSGRELYVSYDDLASKTDPIEDPLNREKSIMELEKDLEQSGYRRMGTSEEDEKRAEARGVASAALAGQQRGGVPNPELYPQYYQATEKGQELIGMPSTSVPADFDVTQVDMRAVAANDAIQRMLNPMERARQQTQRQMPGRKGLRPLK